VKPETRTVNQLFELSVRYVVPLYQRPYVWSEKKQWDPLWEDLSVLLDHQATNGGQTASYSHFLGAIVLEQETQAPGQIPLFTVIDGQQRLTTLQLILGAARSVADALGDTTEAGLLSDLIVNDPRKAKGDERLKVWPTNINRDAFRAAIAPDATTITGDDPNNRVQEAFAYFRDKIAAWLDEGDPSTRLARLATLRVTLTDLVKVVSITLEAGDNAQIIFETLNARGTPLLALDLVKNAVFRQAERQGCDVDGLYHQVWQPELDQELWRKERRQGRLFRAHGELYLMHWLGMNLKKVIPATELFTIFQKDILGAAAEPDMVELVARLNHQAAVYRTFDEQQPGTREAIFFERLEALDITTVMPLVLLLFTHPKVSPTRRRAALATIESWLVRRMLVRLTGKNYNSEVAQLLTEVDGNPDEADQVVRAHLSASTSETNRWPGDDELITSLRTRDCYGYVSQQRLVMVLRAIELSLCDPRTDVLGLPAGLSIEHIMPQQWQRNWPLPSGLTAEARKAHILERAQRLHRLGNLTLTTIPMNSSLSNSGWQAKQKQLNRGSKLFLNTHLIEQYGSGFDEAAIDKRTSELARRICKIWPGPIAAQGH